MKTKNLITGYPVNPSLPKKKILFATVPADGHFNPLTGMAKYFQENGYDIAWYASADYAGKLKKLCILHFPFKTAMEVTGSNIAELFPQRKNIRNKIKKLNFDIINFFINRAEEYYSDILDIYSTFQFDLMVADVAFTAIPFVREKMNIPVISIGVFPLTESSADLPPAGLGMAPSYSFAGKLKQSFLRFTAEKVLFRKANRIMQQLLNKHEISHNNANVFDLLVKKSSLLLQSGTPGFEYFRSDLGKNIRFIGSLLPYKNEAEKNQWFDNRLNKYERIILVTQGTVEKNIEKLLVPVLEALKNTETLVIATTGGSKTQELRSRYPQKNYIIEDFISFADVMPYADVFVTNGGYGGVMIGIEHRLPMVVAGIHEGKNEINARIDYFRLGIDLKTENPSPDQIRSAIEQVTIDRTYKLNVIKLGEQFAAYDPFRLALAYADEVMATSKTIKHFSQEFLQN